MLEKARSRGNGTVLAGMVQSAAGAGKIGDSSAESSESVQRRRDMKAQTGK
jgi:hypothetical protein